MVINPPSTTDSPVTQRAAGALGEGVELPVQDSGVPAEALEPQHWVERHGDAMFAHAVVQLRDTHAAEEVVQAAFLSALESLPSFEGRSSERTWLIGIMRNKIADLYRRRAVEQSVLDDPIAKLPHFLDRFFSTKSKKWIKCPASWSPDPDSLAESREFWKIVYACLDRLTPAYADAFCLREFGQVERKDLCNILGVEPANLGMRLHRARLLLRNCLEKNWIKPGAKGAG